MPICAQAVQQGDGSYLLGLVPSETNLTACPYVVETGSEYLSGPMPALTPAEGSAIAMAIALLWASVWCIKVLARSLFTGDSNVHED